MCVLNNNSVSSILILRKHIYQKTTKFSLLQLLARRILTLLEGCWSRLLALQQIMLAVSVKICTIEMVENYKHYIALLEAPRSALAFKPQQQVLKMTE